MKLFLLLLTSIVAFASDWNAVLQISTGEKIEVTARSGKRMRATLVSATGGALVVREKSGEQSLTKAEIRRVRVYDPGRRVRRGLLWTVIGAAAGAAGGLAVCPDCSNEGHGYKFVGPGVAIGAGIGALGFLSSPYRTLFSSK